MVRNRMIFAFEKQDSARDAAKEAKDTRSGMEPLRIDGDPRQPRPLMGITQVQPATPPPRE